MKVHSLRVSVADRDSVRDLVEDAVKSLRSACQYGVGYGSNYEGFTAADILLEKQWSSGVKSILAETEEGEWDNTDPTLKEACIEIIAQAYTTLLATLYEVSGYSEKEIEDIFGKMIHEGKPFNIRTEEFDGKVLTSIESDKVILSTISKIVTLMYTSNQFLIPDPVFNKYIDEDK